MPETLSYPMLRTHLSHDIAVVEPVRLFDLTLGALEGKTSRSICTEPNEVLPSRTFQGTAISISLPAGDLRRCRLQEHAGECCVDITEQVGLAGIKQPFMITAADYANDSHLVPISALRFV